MPRNIQHRLNKLVSPGISCIAGEGSDDTDVDDGNDDDDDEHNDGGNLKVYLLLVL